MIIKDGGCIFVKPYGHTQDLISEEGGGFQHRVDTNHKYKGQKEIDKNNLWKCQFSGNERLTQR